MSRPIPEAIDDLLARLHRAALPDAWRRAVRLGVSRVGPCDVQLDAWTRAIVRPSARVPGALDVRLETRRNGKWTTTRDLPASTSADRENASPRRSVRVSDELWEEAALHGKPSTVMVTALEEYLARRRKG